MKIVIAGDGLDKLCSLNSLDNVVSLIASFLNISLIFF